MYAEPRFVIFTQGPLGLDDERSYVTKVEIGPNGETLIDFDKDYKKAITFKTPPEANRVRYMLWKSSLDFLHHRHYQVGQYPVIAEPKTTKRYFIYNPYSERYFENTGDDCIYWNDRWGECPGWSTRMAAEEALKDWSRDGNFWAYALFDRCIIREHELTENPE